MFIRNQHNALNVSDLMRIPTLAAEQAYSKVSKRYSFLSTAKVIESLSTIGMFPYSVKTSNTRIEEKRGFVKHTLRFREFNAQPLERIVGDTFPEIVLTNSHDTLSSFSIEMGLYRLACSNGLVVSSGLLESYRVRHVSATIDSILSAVNSLVSKFPVLTDTVARFQSVPLNDLQRYSFAQSAMLLRWEKEKLPFDASRLLETRRYSDHGSSVWSTYNVVQENLTKGQLATRRTVGTREIKSIDSDLSINRELWKLAETYANN